jgi:hypothetical protein
MLYLKQNERWRGVAISVVEPHHFDGAPGPAAWAPAPTLLCTKPAF